MKIALRIGRIALLIVLSFVIFNFFEYVQIVAASGQENNLSLERCSIEEVEQLNTFLIEVDGLLGEVIETSRFVTSYDEASQKYLGFATIFEDLSYPACAQPLYEAIELIFINEAAAYSALPQGSLFSQARYLYFHNLAIKGIDHVPYIIREIVPIISPLPQHHA